MIETAFWVKLCNGIMFPHDFWQVLFAPCANAVISGTHSLLLLVKNKLIIYTPYTGQVFFKIDYIDYSGS